MVLTSGGHRPRELATSIPVQVLREALVAMDPQECDPWAEGYVSPEVTPETCCLKPQTLVSNPQIPNPEP